MKIFANKGRPLSLWIMTGITLLYLLVEFSFNSRLLDAVGGITSETSINQIEWWGRCLSGFAVTLFFWPKILETSYDISSKFWLIFGSTLLIMTVVFFAEKIFVDSLVDNSTPEQRYAAANLMLLQNALVTEDAEVDGLSVDHNQLSAPDGKAFLATFPLMLMATKDIDQKIKEQKIDLIRNLIDKRYGGVAKNFNRYSESLQKLENSYNGDYIKGMTSYNRSLADIGGQQYAAWYKYEIRLRTNHLTPYNVPRRYFGRVRDDVQSSGVPVSSNWAPSDRNGFYNAVADKIKSETESKYRESVTKSAGFYLPPGLTPIQFFNNSNVQNKWRDSLNYPEGVVIEPGYQTPNEFDNAVYSKVIEINLNQQLAKLDAPPSEFDDGQQFEKFGKDNMSVLVAPPIALALSVLGAIAHIFKSLFFLIQCVTGRAFANGYIKSVAILFSIVLMFAVFSGLLRSKITSQDIYKNYLYKNVVSISSGKPSFSGFVIANAIRGTIHIQPIAYPVFESIRKTMLVGFEFGYSAHPETEVSLKQRYF